MALRVPLPTSGVQTKRSMTRRVLLLHVAFLVLFLVIIARLIELQILRKNDFAALAQAQHFGGVELPAKRGEILAMSSKTGQTTVLATNTTLDLVYVDPLITDDATFVAEQLADTLVTPEFHVACVKAGSDCPRELVVFFADLYDPLLLLKRLQSGALLEPLPGNLRGTLLRQITIPDLTELRRLFARDVEQRISVRRMTFVPLKYSATKPQMRSVEELGIAGIEVNRQEKLIWANPEEVPQERISSIARTIAPLLELDPEPLKEMLRERPLRYVPVMRRLPPQLSLKLRELKLASLKQTNERKAAAPTRDAAERIVDPLRSIALIPEHWRFYTDATIASQVVGFLNTNQEAQYGVERTFNAQLRGQKGLISSVSDPQGGQIVTAEQTIINPKDGDTIVLTIDPIVQKNIETILKDALVKYQAVSGQVIVMDPSTGRIVAMANAPLFERNNYGDVFEKEPLLLQPEKENEIVVEVFHPQTNARIVKDYYRNIFTPGGRARQSDKIRALLDESEALVDLQDLTRYYLYLGENARLEIFPTPLKGVWLRYRNSIGVGAYLNNAIQSIYEFGSVMKPITMAIAIDQGEVMPSDIYDDTGPVKVDEFTIKNALLSYYGKVTMTNCLEFSINTCMTSVSRKLGKKLFHRMLERFGFGRITGIALDDELPGALLPWKDWSDALLATAAFGQGVSGTPLQMITGVAALANGGKLMRPLIIDRVMHPDGTTDVFEPRIVDQVITPQTSETISAMLVSSVRNGYAKTAAVPGYRIAGKTGTSQIAGPGGRYEAGTGSTVASFIGYAPVDHPRFVALVKLDRPKFKLTAHGAATAAPMFKDIATYLFKYYGIPPDEE